jgi:hypothetical protein
VPPALERGDDGEADGPTADDEAGLSRAEPGQSHRVLAHGEGLGQRGEVCVQRVGHGQQQQLLQHHVLGQRTRVGVRVADLLHAGRAQNDGHGADAGADGERARRVGTVVHDFGAELVPEDAVGGRVQGGDPDGVHEAGEVTEVGQRVEVRAANAGR